MHTLTTVPQPAPEQFPEMDMQGMALHTATVIPKKGDSFWLCNPVDEIIEAMESGEPFVAHQIIAMQAKRVIIQPDTIARIEEV